VHERQKCAEVLTWVFKFFIEKNVNVVYVCWGVIFLLLRIPAIRSQIPTKIRIIGHQGIVKPYSSESNTANPATMIVIPKNNVAVLPPRRL
jgi:hypothetical protein